MYSIIGGKENQNVKAFRKTKDKLASNGYPVDRVFALVENVYQQIARDIAKKLPKGSLLICVPSTSGNNIIPRMFAEKLSRKFGCEIMPAGIIVKEQISESKLNLELKKRVKDPVAYSIDQKALSKFNGRSAFIIDDLLATGDNSIRLAKSLRQYGIVVDGLVNMVNVTRRYPSSNDLERVINKLTGLAELNSKENALLNNDVNVVFKDYTRQKLNRFERPIKNKKQALDAVGLLKLAAEQENKFNKTIAIKKGQNINL